MGSEPLCLAAMRQTWLTTEARFPSGHCSAAVWPGWRAHALRTTETTDPCRCWAMSCALYFQPMVPKPRGLLLTDSVLFRSSKVEKVQWVLWDSFLLLFLLLPSGVATNSNCHSGYHKHQSSFWLPQTPIVILVTTNTNRHSGYHKHQLSWWLFNFCNALSGTFYITGDLGSYCAHAGEAGTGESAQVLAR